MKKNIIIILAVSFFSLFIFVCCAPKMYTTNYTMSHDIKLANDVQSIQSQGGIIVEVKPLDIAKEREKSFYTQPLEVKYKIPLISEPEKMTLNYPLDFFYGLSPLSVTITNNTDHILRMKDSRIVFIDPQSEEPIYAFSIQNSTLENMAIKEFPIYKKELSSIIKEYPLTVDPEGQLFMNLYKITSNIKFINGLNTEIMPGMKTSGILLFILDPAKMDNGTISFIDIISKVDAAGNPTEKVRFNYKTSTIREYYKTDPNLKKYIKISSEEYEKGLKSPEVYKADTKTKKWVLVN